jgi:hypothetical protein
VSKKRNNDSLSRRRCLYDLLYRKVRPHSRTLSRSKSHIYKKVTVFLSYISQEKHEDYLGDGSFVFFIAHPGKGVKIMETNEGLLSFIHKNAAMGVSTIPQVMSLPQSRAMGEALNSQLREYRSLAAKAQEYANSHGKQLHGPGSAVRAMSGAMLRAQTAMDPSTSRLAELMIRGSTMGTVQMTRRLHQYAGHADKALLDLGDRLLHTEERNIQEMKRFL